MKDEGDVLSPHEVPRELEQVRESALGELVPHVLREHAEGEVCVGPDVRDDEADGPAGGASTGSSHSGPRATRVWRWETWAMRP